MGGRDKECAGGALDGKGSAWMCPKARGGDIQGKWRVGGKKTREPLREIGNECSLPYALCENNASA